MILKASGGMVCSNVSGQYDRKFNKSKRKRYKTKVWNWVTDPHHLLASPCLHGRVLVPLGTRTKDHNNENEDTL